MKILTRPILHLAFLTSIATAAGTITGRIVDHAKTPLGKCRISLVQSGQTVLSNASTGEFVLTGTDGLFSQFEKGFPIPKLVGARLNFNIDQHRTSVNIAAYDGSGSLVAPIWSGEKDPGHYSIDASASLSARRPATSYYLQVQIGAWKGAFRLPASTAGVIPSPVQGSAVPVPALFKTGSAAADSLVVACLDFPVKKFPITSNSQALGDLAIRRPNIILFMADDLGWMDLGYQGSKYYETPHIDKLAGQSVRFPNAYAHPLCSPTRASILSGKEPARLKLTTPGGHLPALPVAPIVPATCAANQKICEPQSARHMELEEFTIAEALKEKGYQTAFLGKWHIGMDEKFWPEAQGFDVNIGNPAGSGPPCGYFDPYCGTNPRLPARKKGEYVVDRLTDEAMDYVDKHKDAPFFMCLFQFGVHAPFQAKDSITARFASKIDPRGKQNYPVMASMVYSLDESMGRLQKKLADLALDSNTILVFYSDNGGNMYDSVQIGAANPFPTHNFPLRMGKGNAYEGGVRVPLLVKWPGTTRPGSIDSNLVNQTDLYPTFLEMAGITSPSKQKLDGVSLVGPLKHKTKLARDAIFCHFPHNMPAPKNHAVTWMRQGDWKLMRFYGEGPNRSDNFELYDLGKDIGESKDVAALHPDIVTAMSPRIQNFLNETKGLVPILNPNYKP